MTITLFIKKENLFKDLSTIKHIMDAGKPEFVEPLSKFLQPIEILQYQTREFQVAINLSPEEFALIMMFNKGIFSYD